MPICTASAFFFFMLVEKNRAQRFFFFFNDPATTEIYTSLHTLSLHDALPIYAARLAFRRPRRELAQQIDVAAGALAVRSEEHTSELQSRNDNSYAAFCLKKKMTGSDATSTAASSSSFRNPLREIGSAPRGIFFLVLRPPRRSTRRYTLFPYTTLFRSLLGARRRDARRDRLGRRPRRLAREPRAEAQVITLALRPAAGARLRFDQERVERAPVGGDQTQVRVGLELLPRGADLLPAGLAGAHIAQAFGLVQLRGDQEGAPARKRADDPDEPVAAPVEGGEEALGLGRRGRARGGGGRGWRGDGHPALPQAVERAADLLAHGALAGTRLERQQESRHLGARKLAERGRQRRAVGAG